jgi:hypothetical protein
MFEQVLDPLFGPPFARRANADTGPVIAVDEAMRGHMIVDFKKCHSACNIDPLSRGIGVQN